MPFSLTRGPTPAAAARRLDAQHVTRLELPGRLRRQLVAVQKVAPGGARAAASLAGRRSEPPLREQRHAAALQRLQLAHDAVAAAVEAGAAGAGAQAVAAHAQREGELERLDRCVERVRHGDVDGGGTGAVGASALAAADRLVV